MLVQLLAEAKIIEKPALLARIVNVGGRFRKIDFELFKELMPRFEEMCAKQNISIDIINTFLDGIVQSKLQDGDASVKKVLTQCCPNLKEKVKNILDHKDSAKFANNYFGLLRSTSRLEFLELAWFEQQAKFLAQDLPYWQKRVKNEGIGFLLHTLVRLNLNSEEANYILEASF